MVRLEESLEESPSHLARVDGELYELPACAPSVGVGAESVMFSSVVRDLGGNLDRGKTTLNILYIVGDEDPLVVVGELPEVGGGGVPALGGAEGDRVAGAGINISLHSGHHLVLGAFCGPLCSPF